MIKQNQKPDSKHPLSLHFTPNSNPRSQTPSPIPSRLSFFGKGITTIDRLDSLVPQPILLSIREIELSHNVITKVENLRQFCNLQVVNLAHNCIIDGRGLGKLRRLGKLRQVMVKGNPFLKSGEGRLEAYKFLLPYETDIELLTTLTQKLAWLHTRKQYLSHLQCQISLITDHNISLPLQCTGPVYNRLLNTILQQHYQYMRQGQEYRYRREIVMGIVRGREEELEGVESREGLLAWVLEGLYGVEEGLERELGEWERVVGDKEELLAHVKAMRRDRMAKEGDSTLFKKLSNKPLLSKASTQNIPKPRFPHKQAQSQYIISQTSIEQQLQLQSNLHLHLNPNLHPNHQVQIHRKPSQSQSKKQIEERFQLYYTNMLTKYNPVYQLLYSPLQSLKSKEKDMLIQTLSSHLKQKSFAAFKAQRLKQQHTELLQKYSHKEQLLSQTEHLLHSHKLSTTQTIHTLQQTLTQTQLNLQTLTTAHQALNTKHSALLSRLSFLQQELSQYKLQGIRDRGRLERYERAEEIGERIRVGREQRVRREVLGVVMERARGWARWRERWGERRGKEERGLLEGCWRELREEMERGKLGRSLGKRLMEEKLRWFMGNFCDNARYGISMVKLSKYMRTCRSQAFIKLLSTNSTYQKTLKAKLSKFALSRAQKKTSLAFTEWKSQTDQSRYLLNLQKAKTFYQSNLLSRTYKNWLVFLKLPIYQQAELSVDLRMMKACKFVALLRKNCEEKRFLQGKFGNLIVFLNRSSRVNNFFRFKKFALVRAELRGIKEKKLATILKINYFYEFIRVAHQFKIHKNDHQTKQNRLLNLRKKLIFDKFNSQTYTKQLRQKKFQRIIEIYRKINIAQSLRESLKEFMIEDKKKKAGIKHFLSMLQLSHNRKLKLKHKEIQLKYILNTNPMRMAENFTLKKEFIQQLAKPMLYKNKLKDFLQQKYYKMMMKHFNQWRVSLFKSQIEYLKIRINQFGPEIEEISKRQKSTFEQKMVLMNIIENKEKTIKGFIKQLEQAEYTIKTKEDKYQKLKEYMHDTGEDLTVIGSQVEKVFMIDSKNRAPERDFDTFLQDERKDYFNSFRRF